MGDCRLPHHHSSGERQGRAGQKWRGPKASTPLDAVPGTGVVSTTAAEGVDSRRRRAPRRDTAENVGRGRSPSAVVVPTRFVGEEANRATWGRRSHTQLRLAFHTEACALLVAVLGAYEPEQRMDRLLREQQYLAHAVAQNLDTAPSMAQFEGHDALFTKHIKYLFGHPLLASQLRAVCDAWEAWAGRVLDAMPGEHLGEEIYLECIDRVLKDNELAALYLERTWLLQAEPGRPLGRLRRPPSLARRAVLCARRDKSRPHRR